MMRKNGEEEKEMFHRIKNVTPLDDFRLRVQFLDGETKIYDVRPLFDEIPVFRTLRDNPALFSDIYVGKRGYGIIWNDEIDLSCDELWKRGEAAGDFT